MRCKVCKSGYKGYYEELRRKGSTIPQIYNECIKIGERFSIQSLYRHFQNHYSKEGVKVIPNDCVIHFLIYLIKDEKPDTIMNRVIPLCKKYLANIPYFTSKKQIYEVLKNVCEGIGIIYKLDAEWEEWLNRPLWELKDKSVNDILKK